MERRGGAGPGGATHWPLPTLLHAFLDAGLTLERFTEGGPPTPVMLALRAHRPHTGRAPGMGAE